MKNKPAIILTATILLISIFFSGCIDNNSENNEQTPKTLEEKAIIAVELLKDGKTQNFYEICNEELKNAISVDETDNIWKSVISSYGEFIKIVETIKTFELNYDVVYVTVDFSKLGVLDIRLVFDTDALIAGFQFVPTDVSDQYTPPDYAIQNSFTETEVTIGSGEWKLPGTLSIPVGEGPFSVVILVHGSGPNDRNETIGPNKPFKDIAWGLASKGIAVLRYEKRTKQYPQEIAVLTNLTIQDEIIDDVINAVYLLMNNENINTDRIFLLGHSLGGYIAPRIAQQDTRLAGLILLAAPTRGLEDLYLEQITYLAELDGIIDENEQKQIGSVEKIVEKIKELNMTDTEFVLGAPKSYWQDLSGYKPVETAETLGIKMLILQGKRDYQVLYEKDFKEWNQTFSNNVNVTLKAYESLNHLFISGTGPPNNTEYLEPSNVKETVIDDIKEWINNN